MQVDIAQSTLEMMDWRDFNELHPTDIIAEWETPNQEGYSDHWVTRIVFQDDPNWAVISHSDTPIIEFYSVNRFGQFVSAYFADTLLEDWGSGLDLDYGIFSWTINAEHMDDIRQWVEDSCRDAGFSIE